jgi:hypothetical protein
MLLPCIKSIISFKPYTVRSPIKLENLASDILNSFIGIKALGIFTIASIPKPIVNSMIIKINVTKPIKLDFIFIILG